MFYFIAAPMLRRLRGFEPFSPEAIHSRRAAVLNFIAAGLFADRESGLRLAVEIAAQAASAYPPPPTDTELHHRVAARSSK